MKNKREAAKVLAKVIDERIIMVIGFAFLGYMIAKKGKL